MQQNLYTEVSIAVQGGQQERKHMGFIIEHD